MDAVKKGSGRPTGDTPTGGSPPHSGTEELSPSRRAAGLCEAFAVSGRTHGHIPTDTSPSEVRCAQAESVSSRGKPNPSCGDPNPRLSLSPHVTCPEPYSQQSKIPTENPARTMGSSKAQGTFTGEPAKPNHTHHNCK